MKLRGPFPSSSRHGASIIGLLIVVVIMLILTLTFMGGGSMPDQVHNATTYTERTRDVVCDTNISTMKSTMMQIQIANPGAPVSAKIMEKKNLLLKCPGGGEYIFKDGQIYCSKHSPPPVEATPAAAPAN